jgi:hypothetical protein
LSYGVKVVYSIRGIKADVKKRFFTLQNWGREPLGKLSCDSPYRDIDGALRWEYFTEPQPTMDLCSWGRPGLLAMPFLAARFVLQLPRNQWARQWVHTSVFLVLQKQWCIWSWYLGINVGILLLYHRGHYNQVTKLFFILVYPAVKIRWQWCPHQRVVVKIKFFSLLVALRALPGMLGSTYNYWGGIPKYCLSTLQKTQKV